MLKTSILAQMTQVASTGQIVFSAYLCATFLSAAQLAHHRQLEFPAGGSPWHRSSPFRLFDVGYSIAGDGDLLSGVFSYFYSGLGTSVVSMTNI
jgi:hypothetical protein